MSSRLPSMFDVNEERCAEPDVCDAHSRKTCWVCFATDEDDRDALWVQPCRCRGTSKYVHQQCLQRWIDEKQKGNVTTKVSCPQCNTEYIIVFPKLGTVVYILDLVERVICKTCPIIAGGILAVSLHWTLVTYGAVSVMQMLGHKEGLAVMERADPLFLLLGLPAIPVMLILGKMLRWEDYVLRLWRKHYATLAKYFGKRDVGSERVPADVQGAQSEAFSIMRILCGALIMPTISTMSGKLLFTSVNSNFQRTLMGFAAFILIKGLLKIFYKQQQYNRQVKRQIRDFDSATGTSQPQS